MNEPLQPPRMTSLDRKIEAARLRTERERAAAAPNHMPTQGLTSQLSTKDKDVPLVRGNVIKNLPEVGMGPRHPPLAGKTLLERNEDILQAIAQLNAQDAATGKQWEAEMLNRVQANLQMPKSAQQAIANGVIPHPGVADAMITLRRAFKDDPDFARSWHDNLAMAFFDASGWANEDEGLVNPNSRTRALAHKAGNRAAAHFMRMAFDVDTGPTTLAARQNHIRSIATDGFANRTLAHRPNSLSVATECPGCPDCEREAQKGWLARPDFLG